MIGSNFNALTSGDGQVAAAVGDDGNLSLASSATPTYVPIGDLTYFKRGASWIVAGGALVIPSNGFYFMHAVVSFSAPITPGYTQRAAVIRLDGTTIIAAVRYYTNNGTFNVTVSTAIYLTAGQTLEVGCAQDSGETLDAVIVDSMTSKITLLKVGDD